MRWSLEHGIDSYLEPGPGNVLGGLLRRIAKELERSVTIRSVEHPDQLETGSI
jgi:hypothetical protein